MRPGGDASDLMGCPLALGQGRREGAQALVRHNCLAKPGFEVTYAYDDQTSGNLGLGYRTGMSDSSGSTAWRYDSRGRLSEESKVISGNTFKTQWTYNARDQVLNQVYPGGTGGQSGETVATAYGKWGLPDTLGSEGNSYVVQMTPDALGRIDLLKLGGNAQSPTLQVDYGYYAWTTSNGRGRLQQIKSGPPGTPTQLQDLSYVYDSVGNVTSITDNKDSPATLSLSYDEQDRLTGTSGTYTRGYTYQAIGNLDSRTSASGTTQYAYEANHKHAAKIVKGTSGSSDKTVTVMARGTYADGAWPQIKLRINGVEHGPYPVISSSWAPYGTTTATLTGNDVVNVVYFNDSGGRQVEIDYVVVEGTTVQAETGAMVYDRGTGDAALDGQDVVVAQQLMDVDGALRFVRGGAAYASGYDGNGNMLYRCTDGKAQIFGWDHENHLVAITQTTGVTTYAYRCDGLSSGAGCS